MDAPTFPLTSAERVVLVEALREYRLRLAVDTPRRVLAEALVFRLGHLTD